MPCAFAPNRIETAEHLSKLTGQTTVVKEQVTTSGRGWSTNVSRSTHEVSRPLLTPDEAMRMKGARKNAQGMITEPMSQRLRQDRARSPGRFFLVALGDLVEPELPLLA